MKTKEFIKNVEELGFGVRFCGMQIRILANGFIISVVYTDQVYGINTCKPLSIALKNEDKLFELMVEYVKTPINEREEETKYYLRHKYINKRNAYLVVDENQNCSLQVMGVDYELPTSDKAKFTEREIENIKDYNKTDLHDFEMIEVEIWIRSY